MWHNDSIKKDKNHLIIFTSNLEINCDVTYSFVPRKNNYYQPMRTTILFWRLATWIFLKESCLFYFRNKEAVILILEPKICEILSIEILTTVDFFHVVRKVFVVVKILMKACNIRFTVCFVLVYAWFCWSVVLIFSLRPLSTLMFVIMTAVSVSWDCPLVSISECLYSFSQCSGTYGVEGKVQSFVW